MPPIVALLTDFGTQDHYVGAMKGAILGVCPVAIRRILDHLGLSPPAKPPPEVREVVRVPVDDQGRQIGASPA
jgi:hypothetical protein